MNARREPRGPAGGELKAARRATGQSQAELAAKAGISRHAVSYWECRRTINPRGWAVRRMAEAEPQINALLQRYETNTRARGMGFSLQSVLPHYSPPNARTRDKSYRLGVLQALLDEAITQELSRMQEREAQRRARLRVICGAKTTRNGTPCRKMSEPGKRRCKHHGGRSTGPRTPEGKARIAEAQRARWARWREGQES